ncbi:MAG: hypothetical protein M3490_02445 [Chloroflexota bacterium]|nr:hypothetical protein [Chloroflexota bacterium]
MSDWRQGIDSFVTDVWQERESTILYSNTVQLLRDNYFQYKELTENSGTATGTYLSSTLQLICLSPRFSKVSYSLFPDQSLDELRHSEPNTLTSSDSGPFPLRLLMRLNYLNVIDDPCPLRLGESWLLQLLIGALEEGLVQFIPMTKPIPVDANHPADSTTYFSLNEGEELLEGITQLVVEQSKWDIDMCKAMLEDPTAYYAHDDSDDWANPIFDAVESRDDDEDAKSLQEFELEDTDHGEFGSIGRLNWEYWNDDELNSDEL